MHITRTASLALLIASSLLACGGSIDGEQGTSLGAIQGDQGGSGGTGSETAGAGGIGAAAGSAGTGIGAAAGSGDPGPGVDFGTGGTAGSAGVGAAGSAGVGAAAGSAGGSDDWNESLPSGWNGGCGSGSYYPEQPPEQPESCTLQDDACVGSSESVQCCSLEGTRFLYDAENACFTKLGSGAFLCATHKQAGGGCGAGEAQGCYMRETDAGYEMVRTNEVSLYTQVLEQGYADCLEFPHVNIDAPQCP